MKTCNFCNAKNPDDAKFCWSCGKELLQTDMSCKRCGHVIDSRIQDLRFCPFCGLNIIETDNTINGHEYVDLGLSVKWATCNIGASKPSDFGDYFAWGETKPKKSYTDYNYMNRGKVITEIMISGNPLYDAAQANWGGTWRLPTIKEFMELKTKCICEWINKGGNQGYLVTGPNGRTIFFPAGGLWYPRENNTANITGDYWSSGTSNGMSAFYCHFENLKYTIFLSHQGRRFYGMSIRPVSD